MNMERGWDTVTVWSSKTSSEWMEWLSPQTPPLLEPLQAVSVEAGITWTLESKFPSHNQSPISTTSFSIQNCSSCRAREEVTQLMMATAPISAASCLSSALWDQSFKPHYLYSGAPEGKVYQVWVCCPRHKLYQVRHCARLCKQESAHCHWDKHWCQWWESNMRTNCNGCMPTLCYTRVT